MRKSTHLVFIMMTVMLAGCAQPFQPPSVQQKVDAQPTGLTQDDMRKLAIDFERKWLQENPAEMEQVGLANTTRTLSFLKRRLMAVIPLE